VVELGDGDGEVDDLAADLGPRKGDGREVDLSALQLPDDARPAAIGVLSNIYLAISQLKIFSV
jgi:hypothetical protein